MASKSKAATAAAKAQQEQLQQKIDQLPEELKEKLSVAFSAFNDSRAGGCFGTADGSEKLSFELLMLQILKQIIADEVPVFHFSAACRFLQISQDDEDLGQSIADILWMAGMQISPSSEAVNEVQLKRLAAIVKDSMAQDVVSSSVLKMSLEPPLLAAAGIIADDNLFQRRLVKINTALTFRQQKYNLLREETEGYSRLNVLLCSMVGIASDADTTAFIANVFSVVGHFDLEPNRVLDFVLDAFEQQPFNRAYVSLIRRFKRSNIAHLLGFKFMMYKTDLPSTAPADAKDQQVADSSASAEGTSASDTSGGHAWQKDHKSTVAPSSLYVLSAVLIAEGLVVMNDLFPYLHPAVETVAATLSKVEKAIRRQITSYGVVSLAASSGTKDSKKVNAEEEQQTELLMRVLQSNRQGNGTGTFSNTGDCTGAAAKASTEVSKGKIPGSNKKPPPPVNPPETISSLHGAADNKPPPPSYPPPSRSGVEKAGGGMDRIAAKEAKRIAEQKAAEDRRQEELRLAREIIDADEEQYTLFQESDAAQPFQGSAENTAENFSSCAVFEGNQYIGLISALISLREWDHARFLLNLMQACGVDPVLLMLCSVELKDNLAALILWSINGDIDTPQGAMQKVSRLNLSLPPSKASLMPTVGFRSPPKKYSASCRCTQRAAAIGAVPVMGVQQLERLSCIDDLSTKLMPLLSYIGYHIRDYPDLICQLCRLLSRYADALLEQSKNEAKADNEDVLRFQSLIELLSCTLYPALTTCVDNSAFVSAQIWNVIKKLPFSVRFASYELWRGGGLAKDGVETKHSQVVLAETVILHGARSDLKRLAKETVVKIGRKLWRYTHCCPIAVFTHILNQVEAFDNLIPFMVEALKLSSELTRDTMTYCLISQLKKSSSSEKLKKGDTHFSQWFSALSKFIATFFYRFSQVELKALLHYLLQQIGNGDSLDLLVLKELLRVMGNCQTLLEVSPIQLEGLSGGPVLRSEVMGSQSVGGSSAPGAKKTGGLQVTAETTRKAVHHLREELIQSGTAIPLLLLIAQVRSSLLFDTERKQLKLISHLFDTAQDVLIQFTDFLVPDASSMDILRQVAVLMPSLSILLSEVGLQVSVAFQLVRPFMRAALRYGTDPTKAPDFLQQWHPFSANMRDAVLEHAYEGKNPWTAINPRLYLLFWSMSLYDVLAPTSRYEAERKRLKEKYAEMDGKKAQTPGSLRLSQQEYRKYVAQLENEMKKLMQRITDLTKESAEQKECVEHMKQILISERESIFPAATAGDDGYEVLTTTIMQHLLYPRLLMSPLDAAYCMHFFITLLHDISIPQFSTLHFIDHVINSVVPLIFCSTETEASFIGYAMNEMWVILNKWYNDEALFNLNALRNGDQLVHLINIQSIPSPKRDGADVAESKDMALDDVTDDRKSKDAEHLMECENVDNATTGAEGSAVDYKRFKVIYQAWHRRMFYILRNGLLCGNKEYMYIRAALILLSKVSEHYPTRAVEGFHLLNILKDLQQREKDRVDLQLMAKSLHPMLNRRSAQWEGAPTPITRSSSAGNLNDPQQIKVESSSEAMDVIEEEKSSSSKIETSTAVDKSFKDGGGSKAPSSSRGTERRRDEGGEVQKKADDARAPARRETSDPEGGMRGKESSSTLSEPAGGERGGESSSGRRKLPVIATDSARDASSYRDNDRDARDFDRSRDFRDTARSNGAYTVGGTAASSSVRGGKIDSSIPRFQQSGGASRDKDFRSNYDTGPRGGGHFHGQSSNVREYGRKDTSKDGRGERPYANVDNIPLPSLSAGFKRGREVDNSVDGEVGGPAKNFKTEDNTNLNYRRGSADKPGGAGAVHSTFLLTASALAEVKPQETESVNDLLAFKKPSRSASAQNVPLNADRDANRDPHNTRDHRNNDGRERDAGRSVGGSRNPPPPNHPPPVGRSGGGDYHHQQHQSGQYKNNNNNNNSNNPSGQGRRGHSGGNNYQQQYQQQQGGYSRSRR